MAATPALLIHPHESAHLDQPLARSLIPLPANNSLKPTRLATGNAVVPGLSSSYMMRWASQSRRAA
jgi:hypothetical protein